MAISVDMIKDLREQTSCGVIECKKALEDSNGDFEKAKEYLKKRGLEIAAKKGSRTAKEGRIEAYIHMGSQIGVLLEINCETSFVAQNEDFVKFSKDVCMQIAAMNPKYISKENVTDEELKEQKDPEGYIREVCLMDQSFFKDSKLTIRECLNTLIGKTGENITISRFMRYKVNEG